MVSLCNQTTYTILIFLSAILSHPHAQTRIHKELDALLRQVPPAVGRQPTPSDRSKLPYTEAAWKEAMRWMPVLPLCMPRATLKEDIYNGWHIPRGTLVFINAGYVPIQLPSSPITIQSSDRFSPLYYGADSCVEIQESGMHQKCTTLNAGFLHTIPMQPRSLACTILCLGLGQGALYDSLRFNPGLTLNQTSL
jgi:hypothetical protein